MLKYLNIKGKTKETYSDYFYIDECYKRSTETDEAYKKCEICEDEKYLVYYSSNIYDKCEENCPTDYYPTDDDLKICYKKEDNPQGYYFDETLSKWISCYESCSYCSSKGNNTNHNCLSCKEEYLKSLDNNCYKECPSGTIEDEEDNKKCRGLCNNTDEYYNTTDGGCEKCYSLCSKCSKGGDSENNNCDLCINNLSITFFLSYRPSSNCYFKKFGFCNYSSSSEFCFL